MTNLVAKCIHAGYNKRTILTPGKIYKIVRMSDSTVSIRNDDGVIWTYGLDRFEIIDWTKKFKGIVNG